MYLKMKRISCLIENKYIIWTSFVSFFFFSGKAHLKKK